MIENYECEGQMNLFDFLRPQEEPANKPLSVGTLIGRVVLGEVEKAVITKVEGNDRHFFYRTDTGGCYNTSEAETDMEKLRRMANENRAGYKTIENYPLSERITVS